MIDEAGVEIPVVEEEVVTPEHLVTWTINENPEVADTTSAGIQQVSNDIVHVTFTCGSTGISQVRTVSTAGCEDEVALEQRLSEVACGVHSKISVGAITPL